MGYQFYFLSQENKDIFDETPDAYIPQYGGFCSWGISGEYCPPYPWEKDCLGPSGNWGHWTIQNNKLYFFLFELPKTKFLTNVSYYVEQGDLRWSSWFNDDAYFSTSCYVDHITDEE
jgi:YHS domain-containing protein